MAREIHVSWDLCSGGAQIGDFFYFYCLLPYSYRVEILFKRTMVFCLVDFLALPLMGDPWDDPLGPQPRLPRRVYRSGRRREDGGLLDKVPVRNAADVGWRRV